MLGSLSCWKSFVPLGQITQSADCASLVILCISSAWRLKFYQPLYAQNDASYWCVGRLRPSTDASSTLQHRALIGQLHIQCHMFLRTQRSRSTVGSPLKEVKVTHIYTRSHTLTFPHTVTLC